MLRGLKRAFTSRWAATAFLALLAVPFTLPFLWMVNTAFKPAGQIYTAPPWQLPVPPTLDNFVRGWGLLDFPRFFLNSLLVAGLTTLGALAASSLTGYAFAALDGRGKRALWGLLLATMTIPPAVTLIPQFMLFSSLGWVNTFLPLAAPNFFGNAFFIFLFRQFFRRLPVELWDSAALDGCNPLQTYFYVALPLARPALAAAGIFAFVGAWNDFLNPLVYLNTLEHYTISLGLSLFHGLFYTQLETLMPMALLAMLPLLALFAWKQKDLLDGISSYGS